MIDAMTAGKAELEERDRVRSLAAYARIILNKFEDWRACPIEHAIDELLGSMSWGEAHAALEYIAWEDSR